MMKFIKIITVIITFCSIAFCNMDRINALGGNAGFWPEDDANILKFPAMVNNVDMIQVSGAGNASGEAMIIWGEDTTWGFYFDGTDADNNNWFNLIWGDGNYGLLVGLSSASEQDEEIEGFETNTSSFGLEMGFGMNMNLGEIGVLFVMANEDDGVDNTDDPKASGLMLNFRKTQNVWLFKNMLTSFEMINGTQGDELLNQKQVTVDLFTTLPTIDGVNATFAMGFGFWNETYNSGNDGAEDRISSKITLPRVHLGVEADVTDWAKVRFGLNHEYVISGKDGDDYTWTGAGDENGVSNFSWNFGLGFDYGTFTLDMVLENTALFNDPVRYITGRNDEALSSSATLTWSF